ncbi:MAG: aminotransferase class I/II-fold pyridoxal phosphate-dependent enzyme [Candidatus Wallbacteria bacterium]|nr:aminotransferase class I/II-fold pyridoxal phosphate-dependent enzyme [Candidatus Wallbacteria bacterium]
MRIVPRHSFDFSFSWILQWIVISEEKKNRLICKARKSFADSCGVSDALFFDSARSAFSWLLECLKFPSGSAFILPEYDFFIYRAILRQLGYRVIDCPVRSTDLQMDCEKLDGLIDGDTRAIIVCNLHSRCTDMLRLREIADRHNLLVIQDNVQSFGTLYRGVPLPVYGDYALYSFGTGKHLPCFGGGALVAASGRFDTENYETLRTGPRYKGVFSGLAEWLFTRRLVYAVAVFPVFFLLNLFCRDFLEKVFFEKQSGFCLPVPAKMPDFKLYLLGLRLEGYVSERLSRAELAEALKKGLTEAGIDLPEENPDMVPDYLFLQLQADEGLSRKLMLRGVDCRHDFCGFSSGRTPALSSLYLPLYAAMTFEDIAAVIRAAS